MLYIIFYYFYNSINKYFFLSFFYFLTQNYHGKEKEEGRKKKEGSKEKEEEINLLTKNLPNIYLEEGMKGDFFVGLFLHAG